MLIALINDSHWGARGDSEKFLNYFSRFYQNIFFPYLQKNNINQVIHLGDLVDKRKNISFTTANRMRKEYIIPSQEMGLQTSIIVGNHDTYFKDTNEINALRELIMNREGFTIYSNPEYAKFDGLRTLMLPWICSENEQRSLSMIKSNSVPVVFAHLELVGFEMSKGQMMEHGMDSSMFQKYKSVYTGHYHHKSSKKNIHYLGTQYEMTWIDYNDPKGFHILDTETLKLTFVPNPERIHIALQYNEEVDPNLNEDCSGKIIKLVVKKKTDEKKLDAFVKKLQNNLDVELKIVDEHLNFETPDIKNIKLENLEDTLKIVTDYANSLDVDVDKKKMISLLSDLYKEAQELR